MVAGQPVPRQRVAGCETGEDSEKDAVVTVVTIQPPMPRFVLLEHDHPTPHLDLLFEVGEVLWAWRLAQMPAEEMAVAATRNFDHRLVYLDYEGPISGDRGRVRRVDR